MDMLTAIKEIHDKAEEMLLEYLAEKPCYQGECKCKRKEGSIKTIHEGNDDEIIVYCLECGGTR